MTHKSYRFGSLKATKPAAAISAAAAAAALLALTAGCGGGGGSTGSAYTTQTYAEDGITTRTATDTSNGIVTTVSVPKTDYVVGENVVVTLTRTNPGRASVPIAVSAMDDDLLVRATASGPPLFNTYYGKGMPLSIVETPLASGASKTNTAGWNQTDDTGTAVSPGVYQLTIDAYPGLPIYITIHPAQ